MAVRPVAAVRKLVILEDGLLSSLANRPEFADEFPSLRSLKGLLAKKSGCGSCGHRATNDRAATFTAVKMALATMSDERRRLFKSKLNAAQIRVTYRNGSKIVHHTF